MNLTSKTENFVYIRCGIMEIFKKSGLVDEALGKLGKPYSIYCLIMDGLLLNQMMLRDVVKYEF